MSVIKSGSGLYWHVVYNGTVLAVESRKKDAERIKYLLEQKLITMGRCIRNESV